MVSDNDQRCWDANGPGEASANDQTTKNTQCHRSPRVRGRPFKAGNPGRPRGAKNRTTRVLEELLEGQAEQLLRTAIANAGSGDGACQKMLMDRYYPARRGRPVHL